MTVAAWNHAPKRLWKRVSVYIRPDIHAAAGERDENFTLFINNALARKYDLDPCMEGGVNRVKQIRRVEKATASLDEEIAYISAELEDDRLEPCLRDELDVQRAEAVSQREERMRAEAAAGARVDCIRAALDAIIGDGTIDRYRRMLPENDPHGDLVDALDDLVERVARRCRAAVDPSELIAEVRRRSAAADAGEGS